MNLRDLRDDDIEKLFKDMGISREELSHKTEEKLKDDYTDMIQTLKLFRNSLIKGELCPEGVKLLVADETEEITLKLINYTDLVTKLTRLIRVLQIEKDNDN